MISADLVELARQIDLLEVAGSFGAVLRRIATNEYAGPCPVCGGRDRFAINTRKAAWHCRGCDKGGDAISLVQNVEQCCFGEAVEKLTGGAAPLAPQKRPAARPPADDAEAARRRERDLAIAAKIVTELRPLASVPTAKRYLRLERLIDIIEVWEDLQRCDAVGWHPSVYFSEPGHPLHGQRLGCIVSIMTDPITAERTGAIARTYIGPDGRKVGPAKTLGAPRGVVRLSPDDAVEGGLFLCEGSRPGSPQWRSAGGRYGRAAIVA